MKYTSRIATAILVAMSLSLPAEALSYTGLGEVESQKSDKLAGGLTYTELTSRDKDKAQNAYIFEYSPNGGVVPIVRWGSTVWGKDRLTNLVASSKTELRPIFGALNGDFYSMQTGVPLGIMISDGQLISGDGNSPDSAAIGFFADGSAVIGKPGLSISVTNTAPGSTPIKVDSYNKFPTKWGSYLVDGKFATTSMSTEPSLEIVLQVINSPAPQCQFFARVTEIVRGDCNTAIPEGGAVLTIADSNPSQAEFASIKVGDTLTFETKCASESFASVKTAIGGGDIIVENGAIPAGIVDEEHEKVANPRTAVGIRKDGSVVFFAVDGRSDESRGLTLSELASTMLELGCVSALNLDGGGSTGVMAKLPGTTDTVYVNTPSESYRSIANGILLAAKYDSDGIPAVMMGDPSKRLVLTGSTTELDFTMLDRNYMPIKQTAELPASAKPESVALAFAEVYDSKIGSLDANRFTAGYIPGTYKLNVTSTYGGKQYTDTTEVTVTNKLDSFKAPGKYIKLTPGTTANLQITAMSDGQRVICTPSSFYYTINGEHFVPNPADYPDALVFCPLGYVDKNGNFVSFKGVEGEVEVGIWFNDFVEYVTISIGDDSEVVADFEEAGQLGGFSISSSGGMSELRMGFAEKGFKSSGSLEIDYSFSALSGKLFEIKNERKIYVAPEGKSIKLWISGDVSGNMSATLRDQAGNPITVDYVVTKDYSRQLGWREITAVLPAEHGLLELETVFALTDVGVGKRTLGIDQIMIDYGKYESPLSGLDNHWAKDAITQLYDMAVIRDEDCETLADGSRYYSPDNLVTRGEFAKLLVRNLGLGIEGCETGIPLEADTPAELVPYIRCAIAHGLMSGYGVENGVTIFKSSAEITREEVCKVIALLLSVNGSPAFDFTDVGEISSWALESVKKCVLSGVIRGYSDNTIRPKSTVTRAELASMFTRF